MTTTGPWLGINPAECRKDSDTRHTGSANNTPTTTPCAPSPPEPANHYADTAARVRKIDEQPWGLPTSLITVTRVLTDNGVCYRSRVFAHALGQEIRHKRTRPY